MVQLIKSMSPEERTKHPLLARSKEYEVILYDTPKLLTLDSDDIQDDEDEEDY